MKTVTIKLLRQLIREEIDVLKDEGIGDSDAVAVMPKAEGDDSLEEEEGAGGYGDYVGAGYPSMPAYGMGMGMGGGRGGGGGRSGGGGYGSGGWGRVYKTSFSLDDPENSDIFDILFP